MFPKITFISLILLAQLNMMFAAPPSNPSKPKLAEVNVSISYNEGGQFFVESCCAVNGTLTFTLEADPTEERKYLVNLLGSATPLVDYNITGLTDTITFAPGQTQLVFPIIVTMDILSELDEDINVTVIDLLNQVFISSAQAEIHDSFTPKINNGQDITVCRGAEIILSADEGGAGYLWSPAASLDNTTSSTVTYTSNNSGKVNLLVNLGTCQIRDTIDIRITNPSVILTSSDDTICGPEVVDFNTITAQQGGTYSWRPASLFPDQNKAFQSVKVSQNATVIVSYTIEGCTASDTIFMKVAPGVNYSQPFTDTLACKGEKISFGDLTNAKNYTFTPFSGIDFTDFNNPFIIANKDISYNLSITATDGSCTNEYSFVIKVAEGSFDLDTPDQVKICFGDSTLVKYSYTPKTSVIVWTPMDSTFRFVNDTSFYLKPTVTTEYTGTFSIGHCVFTKKITVKVDSLPELPITTFWPKPFYCKGETLVLSSPTYDKTNFPDITYDWGQPLGGIEPFTALNLTLITQDTFLYIRKTTNGACYMEDSIKINVKVPLVSFTLTDTIVCANEPVPVTVITDMVNLEWKPAEGVNCSDCKSVIITTPVTQTFTVTGKSDGCPAGGSIKITVKQPVIALSSTDTTVCPNEPVEVTVLSPATNLAWSPTNKVSCVECVTTILTTALDQDFLISGILDGCPAFGGIAVHISGPIAFGITVSPADNVAIGNPITASVENPVPGASYQWKINGRDLGTHGSSYDIVVETTDDLIEASLISGPGGNYCTGFGAVRFAGIAPYIDVPNAFTPNGDSKNDVFKAVIPFGVQILEMTIVNRWGQKVFTEGNTNNGWDGKFNNKDAPSDTYLFVVKYQLAQGGVIESRRGEVTLYR